MASFSIGDKIIGDGCECFIIAEAGVNHGGSVDIAKKMINTAAQCGVDAVKMQTFAPDKLVSANVKRAKYQAEGMAQNGTQIDMLRQLVLPDEAYPELMQTANEQGLLFLSTPFDEDNIDFLYDLGVCAFKVSSGDLENLPFLAYLASKRLPVILSTGMSTFKEVDEAVTTIKESGNPPLALLHCVSDYPTEVESCNLRVIEKMRQMYNVPIGWSDHTLDTDIAVGAATLGASIVEKHFTLDKQAIGPDHRISADPGELAEMVTGIRKIEKALGGCEKQLTSTEAVNGVLSKRSLFWRHSLKERSIVKAKDLIALRPGDGIPPKYMSTIVGKRTRKPVRGGNRIEVEDIVDLDMRAGSADLHD